ncbi:hypothetical protein PGTUg99_024064 [Puccinia graminis f. sp. tritici]|uniref:Uncharacterized protein n=1 Tax=Puccinia graminis f. sp. tritici TaxID=56615 RepID=A0A5B0R6R6_PUCGR|nr:hypothetical protein PGTUg99_024064 [Puccinia graminis f. sp. tritici]
MNCIMAIGNIPSTIFNEYPQMKTYRNRKLPMSIFLGAILVFSSLIIFNLFTQGRSDKSRPFISLKFLDEKLHSHGKSPSGYKYSCDTATVRMGDNVFMVIPSEPPDEPMTESEGQLGSPGAFQWTVYEITRADREEKKNEFRYRGQKLNCVVSHSKIVELIRFFLNLEPFCFVAQASSKCFLCITPGYIRQSDLPIHAS